MSEAALTNAFLTCYEHTPGAAEGLLLSEVETGEGIPDLMLVRSPGLSRIQLTCLLAELPAAALLNGSGAVLAELQFRPHTLGYLAQRTGLSREHTERSARFLCRIGWAIRSDKGSYSLDHVPFPDFEITAFEFKLKDSRRAVQQAIRYKQFAHRALVVLPGKQERGGLAVSQLALGAAVGVATFDPDDCSVRYLVRPLRRRPRSRHAYMHVLGRILQHMELGDRTSGRRFPRQP